MAAAAAPPTTRALVHEALQSIRTHDYAAALAAVSELDRQLVAAARAGQLHQVQSLLDAGASAKATHGFGDAKRAGCSALWWAVWKRREATARLLVSSGADCNQAAANGGTPFLSAIGSGQLRIAELLRNAGADIRATDNEGHIARAVALTSQA